jgi:hypothetical protein
VAAVRAILSTLNDLAQGRSVVGGARPWRWAGAAGVARAAVPGPWEGPYAHAGAEPLLDDLLCDPLVRLLMQADRVEPLEVRRLLGLRQEPIGF